MIEMVSSADGSLTWGTVAEHRDHCHHRLLGHSWSIPSFFPQPPWKAQGLATNLVVMITAAYDELPNGRHTEKHTQDIPFLDIESLDCKQKANGRSTKANCHPTNGFDISHGGLSEAWLTRL